MIQPCSVPKTTVNRRLRRVSHYPQEDHKLRASNLSRRRGGNCPNTLEVLQQLIALESTERASLHLITVLPGRHSDGTQYIQSSLQPFVDLDRCIYREAFLEPASSYVIRSQASDSRTIINYNQLPDMTLNDFIASCTSLQMGRDSWFHFEVIVSRCPLSEPSTNGNSREEYPKQHCSAYPTFKRDVLGQSLV